MSTSWVSHISLILCPPFQAGPEAARPSSDSFPRFQIYVRIPASEKRSRGEGYSGLAGTQQLRYNRQYLRAPGHGFQETACNENEPDSQHHPWHLSRDLSRRRELGERTGLQKKILRFSIHEKPEYFQLVPVVGLEPTRCRHQRILSPSRLPIPSHWPVDTGLLYRRSERNSSPFSHALTPYRSARRTIRRAQRLWVLYSFIRPPSSLAETRLPLPVSQFRIARASA